MHHEEVGIILMEKEQKNNFVISSLTKLSKIMIISHKSTRF